MKPLLSFSAVHSDCKAPNACSQCDMLIPKEKQWRNIPFGK